jgi:hypothetical protein
MTPPPPRPRTVHRSRLDSPWLAAALVVIVVSIIAAILVLPGRLGPLGPGPSGTLTSSTAPTASPTAAAPTFVRPTPSPRPSFTSHVVHPGDTLNSIARAFRTTARSIAWWNRGAYPTLDPESQAYDPDHLEVGWVLVLIPDTVVDDTNPPTPSPNPNPTPGEMLGQ